MGKRDIKIVSTMDYKLFKRIKGNRDINKGHLKELANAFNKNPELIKVRPILVNEKYEIIDGQHTFQVLKSMNLPIYYIKIDGLSIEHVITLNSSAKQWDFNDYAKSYAEQGNKNYITYLEYRNNYPNIKHIPLVMLLSNCSNLSSRGIGRKSFIGGQLLVEYDSLQKRFDNITEILELYPSAHIITSKYCCALVTIMASPLYDHTTMKNKLSERIRKNPELLRISHVYTESLRDIEGIYNAYSRNPVRFF